VATSLTQQTVLVLGGGGYIGSHFRNTYPSDRFLYIGHSDANSIQPEFYKQVKTILNLSASKLHATKEESRSANFDFPRKLVQLFSNQPIKWVQAASYYELQVTKGRRDYYSSDKLAFRNYLVDLAADKRDLNVSVLLLPHIFGGSEAESRIIPTLKNMNNGADVALGSENQLLPILHISDAVRALRLALMTKQKICTPRPMWHGRLQDLARTLANSNAAFDRVQFITAVEKYQESRLEYPELLENFSPMMSFEQFVKSFKNGDLE